MREKIDCLKGKCAAYLNVSVGLSVLAYLSPMGWPSIYSVCYSQLVGSKDSFPLDEIFLAFIEF